MGRIFLSILMAWFLSFAAQAQSLLPPTYSSGNEANAPSFEKPLTETEAQALLSRLSDQDVRAILLQQLALGKEQTPDEQAASVGDFVNRITVDASKTVTTAVEKLPVLFSGQGRAFAAFYERLGGFSGVLAFLGYLAAIISAGLAAEFLFRRVTRGWIVLPKANEERSLRETMKLLAKRLAGETVGVLVFLVTSRTVAEAILPVELAPFIHLIMIWLVAVPRLAGALGRFMHAPRNPDYRIVHTDDKTAKGLERHQIRFVLLIGLSAMLPMFNAMNGVPLGETRLGFWLNFSVHAYVIWFAYAYRHGLRMMMRGSDEDVTQAEEWIAQAYPAFVMFTSLFIWWIVNILVSYNTREVFEFLNTAPHYTTMALLIMAPVMDTGIRGLVHHLVPPMIGEGPVAERAYYATKRSYIRIGRVLVFGLVLITIADIWGIVDTLTSSSLGVRFAASAIDFLLVLSFGYLVYEVVSLYINRKLAAEITATGYDPENADFGGDGGGTGGSRLSTVLPLILAVSRAAIIILFLLIALSEIGVDTTPLLAGAGILGLAIGFGAQKLVTDVVSGIFFLIDDAFRTGEYVEVEGTFGTVEKISIRSMQLRHHKGPVHTIPYGEIPKLTNYSRDWVIMKLRFTVPFDTDPNKVKKIFKKIGFEMLEHPELGDDFLQPFKSQGVLEIDDVGMVIRGKFMAKPGKQFMIRKEIFNRVSAAFAENGIDFARREVRVAIPSLDSKEALTEEDRAAIAAAASQAADTVEAAGVSSSQTDR